MIRNIRSNTTNKEILKQMEAAFRTNTFDNFPEESKINQSWVLWVAQKFREVLVLTPSKVTHLNLSPTKKNRQAITK